MLLNQLLSPFGAKLENIWDLFKGIGVKIATKVFETLGEDCLKKISEDKSLLDKVEGLTSKQKTIIYEGVVTNELNNFS